MSTNTSEPDNEVRMPFLDHLGELRERLRNSLLAVFAAAIGCYIFKGALFRLMSPAQQQVLFENTARSIGDAPREIQIRHIGHCLKADPAYGAGVAKALGIALSEVPA